jgi:hypothetical protein
MEPIKIQAAWRQLIADQKTRDKVTTEMPSVETQTRVSSGMIRLAISDGEYCALLLPISPPDSMESDRISQFISVRHVTLGLDGKPIRFLEVRCEDDRLNEVFARVVSDILRRIEAGASGVKAIDEALAEFRRLLQKQMTKTPDDMVVVGLVGELLTLIEILELNSKGVAAWHGPDSDRHDFRAGTVTIEVKTSLGADGNKIHINGMKQLDSEGAGSLVIRHIRIEPDPDGGLTVPALVAKARALLTDWTDFDKKLEALGYTDEQSDGWENKCYRLVGSCGYEVQDGFPKLVPTLLNVTWPIAGLSNVSYVVDLGVAAEHMFDQTVWLSKLEEFCSCL